MSDGEVGQKYLADLDNKFIISSVETVLAITLFFCTSE